MVIVENDRLAAEKLRDCLIGYECLVKTLDYGKNTRFRAGVFQPDVILLSAELSGGLFGLVLCSQFKRDDLLADVPIVLITATLNADRLTQHKKLPTAADAYLTKPFSQTQLIETIGALIPLTVGDIGEDTLADLDDTWREQSEEERIVPVPDFSVRRTFSGARWESTVGYCRGIRIGNVVAITGTAAIEADGSVTAPTDAYAQTKRCLAIISAALNELGSRMDDVIRTRIYVTDIELWEEVGRAHREVFEHHPPATTMVQVSRLIDPRMLVEIEADAVCNFV
ncbi:MAG: response regulator [Myxococcales bacterium]|nr:response regulator [Myxococcales bacterium]